MLQQDVGGLFPGIRIVIDFVVNIRLVVARQDGHVCITLNKCQPQGHWDDRTLDIDTALP